MPNEIKINGNKFKIESQGKNYQGSKKVINEVYTKFLMNSSSVNLYLLAELAAKNSPRKDKYLNKNELTRAAKKLQKKEIIERTNSQSKALVDVQINSFKQSLQKLGAAINIKENTVNTLKNEVYKQQQEVQTKRETIKNLRKAVSDYNQKKREARNLNIMFALFGASNGGNVNFNTFVNNFAMNTIVNNPSDASREANRLEQEANALQSKLTKLTNSVARLESHEKIISESSLLLKEKYNITLAEKGAKGIVNHGAATIKVARKYISKLDEHIEILKNIKSIYNGTHQILDALIDNLSQQRDLAKKEYKIVKKEQFKLFVDYMIDTGALPPKLKAGYISLKTQTVLSNNKEKIRKEIIANIEKNIVKSFGLKQNSHWHKVINKMIKEL